MKVDLLDNAMVNSDLGVVNAARCSFDKESQWELSPLLLPNKPPIEGEIPSPESYIRGMERQLQEKDVKLITYLAAHHHWTPFSHAQEVFSMHLTGEEMLYFIMNANLSGFEWVKELGPFRVRGSLYAWLTNYQWLDKMISDPIIHYLHNKYPVSSESIVRGYVVAWPTNSYVQHIPFPTEDENRSYTLRIHAPIFVKRQLETHRRNFVMTDIEDFAQNEVSRRYVDSEPEFYTPKEWRIQAKDKKQGSNDERLDELHKSITEQHYYSYKYTTASYYKAFNSYRIAHEQSRMLLPLSTYTTWWWTGSVKSWKRMVALRLDEHAQGETRELAQLICDAIPVSLS